MQSTVVSAIRSKGTNHIDFLLVRILESKKRRKPHTPIITAVWSEVKGIHTAQQKQPRRTLAVCEWLWVVSATGTIQAGVPTGWLVLDCQR